MQQIADRLGLEQYTQRFADPTDQDLREIGVPLGQKILAAIREDMGSPMPVTSETALVNRADHAKTPQRAAKKMRSMLRLIGQDVAIASVEQG